MGPTRDFEKWKPDGNTRVQVLSSPGAGSDNELETDTATDAEFAPDAIGKSLVSANPSLDRIAPLTSYQGAPSANLEIEQRKQAKDTSGPFLHELRGALIDYLDRREVGEQSRLADSIGCGGGTLSKFKNGSQLPEHHAEALQRAIGLQVTA